MLTPSSSPNSRATVLRDTSVMTKGAIDPILSFLRAALKTKPPGRPLLVGLCGAQGSGKSTVSAQAVSALTDEGHRALALSLDDLYLMLAERETLAKHVHPLLRTRGVPGTHDIALGEHIFDAAGRAEPFRVPSFDKAIDDRAPQDQWRLVDGPVDLVLMEGWCVGAQPQAAEALIEPINELEAKEDPSAIWRIYVNQQLEHAYRALFTRLDHLILLTAPDFSVVHGWRKEQEDQLRRRVVAKGQDGGGVMDDTALHRFTGHYERITRHILDTMPRYADLTIRLRPDRTLNTD